MKPEDKQLLLQDLCARLPYGIIGLYSWKNREPYNRELTGILYDELKSSWNSTEDSKFLPYLRPMSSMTEEEKKEFIEYAGYEIEESVNGRHYEYYLKDFCGTPDNPSVNTNGVDWLNKKMFDYRGLIPKDLAISTEVFNPYNKD